MNGPGTHSEPCPGYPRYFKIAGHWINSYKVLLCVGIYTGTLMAAAAAQSAGVSPLRVGLGVMIAGLLGVAGARIYHVMLHAQRFAGTGEKWTDPRSGGMGVFGALITVVPFTGALGWWLQIPFAQLWDFMGAGIQCGGFWIRFGCVFNGCCCGRETSSRYGLRLHNVRGEWKRRIPVQLMEMGWWLIGGVMLLWLWQKGYPQGTYALGVLAWYGLGRFWLEPLREKSDMLAGKVRVNQVVAAALAIGAGGMLLVRALLA
jgi:phosphatidylglycerol:prolipoprotein diacylglycerol transferase